MTQKLPGIDGPDEIPPEVRARFEEEELANGRRDADRPAVRMGAELAEDVDGAVGALRADANVYSRDGALVHVIRTSREEAIASGTVVNGEERFRIIEGTPQVRPLAVATLRERLTRVCKFYKWDARKDDWARAIPSDHIVQAVHARGEWDGVRELVGIIETPSLRPDGGLIERPGYDRATRFLYAPGAAFPPIPSEPTQGNAAIALRDLCEVFIDFPFASEAARYVPIAALLTIVARPAIQGEVPAFIFDAPTPGTGKSLCADAVSTIATGRPAPRGTFPPDIEELEKVLAGYALMSANLVGFDNLDIPFGGAPLDKVLTAPDTVDLRVLGKSEQRRLIVRYVMLVSGNNVAVQGDTVRRVLISRMESELERPEERDTSKLKHYPLLPWVQAERTRLVAAALTILRAFVVAGRPQAALKAWSYQAWSALVAQAIVFAGGADVLGARPSTEAGDTGERALHAALLMGLLRLDTEKKGLTAKDIVRALYPGERDAGGPPDGFDEMREAVETFTKCAPGKAPGTSKLGSQLRRFRNRVVGGMRLAANPDRTGIVRWSVTNV